METRWLNAFMVQEIVDNAKMIDMRIQEFGIDHDKFASSTLYQDMLTMPMLRICEIVAKYKDDFKVFCPDYPWDEVAKMRSKIAHPYGGFNFFFVWGAIQEDLSDIVAICERYLEN